MTSPASRKSAERQRRKDAGERRVEIWISEYDWSRIKIAAAFDGSTPKDVIKHAISLIP